jgi:aerobic carbon-monoxide dehydrogenase small subunit
MESITIRFTLNGQSVEDTALNRWHAIDFLRERFELSSTRVGCEHGVCGACSIRVDGRVVRGCLMLAAQLDGANVETLEGLNASGEIKDLQEAFHARNAMQCGYCTSGMLMTLQELLLNKSSLNRNEIREHISGNYCRCTGYEAIVDATEKVAADRGIQMTKDTPV